MGINVYDFDKTIYRGDSSIDFYLFSLKHKPSIIRHIPKQTWATLRYMLKKITKENWKETFFSFLTDIDTDDMVRRFWAKNEKKIYPWYLQQKENTDIIISASPEFLLAPICNKLDVWLIGSVVDPNTGKFLTLNCKGTQKVWRLQIALQDAEIDQFYSDSYSDAPMVALAKEAYICKRGKIQPWNA